VTYRFIYLYANESSGKQKWKTKYMGAALFYYTVFPDNYEVRYLFALTKSCTY